MTTTDLSQAWDDSIVSSEAWDQVWSTDDHGKALAMDTAWGAEIALRGDIQYIETKEWSNLSFRWLLQPLGVPEDHVKAMLADKQSYPWLNLHQAHPKTGKVAGYGKPNESSPEIIQKRLTAATLREVIQDEVEIARIEKVVKNGWEYPLFSYLSPKAIHMYADFMRKYTNNPRIRIPKDNTESESFRHALKWDSNGDKLKNAGIPLPGYFSANNARVGSGGEWSIWVASVACKNGLDALWLRRDDRDSSGFCLTFNGSSPLFFEDIPST